MLTETSNCGPGGPDGVLWTHADRISSELVSFLS